MWVGRENVMDKLGNRSDLGVCVAAGEEFLISILNHKKTLI